MSVGKEKKSYFKLKPFVGKGYNKKLLSGVLATYCGTPPDSNCATCVSSLWAAAVVSLAPLVQPVKVEAGEVAPWFGQPGGGVQYKFNKSITELIKDGVIRRVN